MFYVRLCYDKPGQAALRAGHVETHRAYFREQTLPLRILSAGPLCDETDESVEIGSFMLVEADSIETVRALHEGDPYTALGLFAEVRIDRLNKKIG
jgi:uncharacterized protein YciI